MIAIVTSHARERAAFSALCATRQWPAIECASLRAWTRLLRRARPKVVVTRHKLVDGFSDDVLATIAPQAADSRVVVLMSADSGAAAEARQVALGADWVQRDPVRIEVLMAYLTKYYTRSVAGPMAARPASLRFAQGTLDPLRRILSHRGAVATLTQQEAELIEYVVAAAGQVVTYDTLYSDIMRRRFEGDTSNMRVLLRKMAATTRKVGIDARRWIEVIPKTGYRYLGNGAAAPLATRQQSPAKRGRH